ncbi:hypothetical protein [Fibrella aquatilis]|uniref:Phosphopantetheine adenylyltransferase n=1 Tax=Fibrella aquatilis TaxID=2817059 RepID=A0A939K122_9BACT|nr:hypothetical protein [Fibrella aquatilis]MBO0934794.1 hypothetical protein [Fibrella aquatilis]
MESIFRLTLGLASVINLLPAALLFLPQNIAKSYGIAVPDGNYELLLRHRAVLFGLVGGLLLYSAFTRKYYTVSVVMGLVSMISFVALYYLIDKPINAELKRVMIIDILAIVALLIGLGLYWFSR